MCLYQVYGALPSDARSRQALLFNTPRTGFNTLVASDAIGMGLNLNIRWALFIISVHQAALAHPECPELHMGGQSSSPCIPTPSSVKTNK